MEMQTEVEGIKFIITRKEEIWITIRVPSTIKKYFSLKKDFFGNVFLFFTVTCPRHGVEEWKDKDFLEEAQGSLYGSS